ncbi:VOC family protein [Streptomyces sp. NBC_00091]|uniref:VOC family protein n=1 Tax=Streptomyces sp. NBC_00091 TaxID=2975648 RepID=UPI00224EBCB0|nr:VOC family protein [Streptomyces sp. NBC_00091]MCX5378922.1 VOC family protein [Streptomyces sp. NBC_00091]
MAKEFQVTYDCADPGAQAVFWAEALGYRVQPPPEGFADWATALTARGIPPEHHNDRSAITDPDGKGPRVFFQKVPEGKTVAKNRLHLDLRSAPGLTGDERMAVLEEEATRLEGLGAKRLYRLDSDGVDEGIIVMTDPEGNEFCLD